jgi:hypothetical protein
MTIIQPLDLQYWLVNTFSGSWEIFIFAAFIAIAIGAAYFKMNTISFLMIYILFTVLMANFFPINLLFIAILLVGLFVFYLLSKFINR